MDEGPPELYRMVRCKRCPRCCKPCLTIEEAEAVQANRMEAKNNGSMEVWKMNTVCDACHAKSNRRQNELTAEKHGHGKPVKGKKGKIAALLAALNACEAAGYELSDEELRQVYAAMKELGVG